MGLDMYLSAERYVSGYRHSDAESRAKYQAALDLTGFGAAADADSPSATISVTVAYWRKANAIHKWFVDNVQDGRDECQSSYVAREQLVELRDLCKFAVETRALAGVAEDTLPTQAGFFFGSTDHDDWYWRCLEDTVSMLDRVLANVPESTDFYYRASW